MHPFLFKIGGFRFPTYGLMIALGYIAGMIYIFRKNRKTRFPSDILSDLVFYTILFGILGGKLFYVLTYWSSFGVTFAAKISYMFRTFQYGFVFYGGFLLGSAAFVIYAKRAKINPLAAADLFAPALALGHAFGRIGCFSAGCCYGAPTSSPLGVIFSSPDGEIPAALLGIPLHPVQLYESLGNFLIFITLNFILDRSIDKKRSGGYVFCWYAVMYGTLRFCLEFLRGDDRGAGLFGLSPAQTISAVMILSGAAAVYFIRRKYGEE